jgi:hypothetical protein
LSAVSGQLSAKDVKGISDQLSAKNKNGCTGAVNRGLGEL